MALLSLISAPVPAFLSYALVAMGLNGLREGNRAEAIALLVQGGLCAAGTIAMVVYGLNL